MKTLLPALLLAVGCASAPAVAPDPVALRTWDLPPGVAPRMAASLSRVFAEQDGPDRGHASEGPGGSLVVVANEGVLDGVDELVRRAASQPATPAPATVDLRWWVVRGDPAPQTTRGPGLEAVSGALDAVVATDGPQALTLVATRDLRTIEGDRGEIEDEGISLRQMPSIVPGTDTVVADLEVGVRGGGQVKTRLAVASGTLAVLSQAGVDGGTGSLYVLVRPEILRTP